MTPGGNFNCSWERCGKSFNRKSDLCRHYRIHTNERPYHCNIKSCNKSFIQRSALTIHLRTHTGEKPHVCGQEGCHKAFSDSSSLARHRRVHTGKRLYICQEPTCKRSFCRKATLVRHQHRSHPPGTSTQTSPEDAVPEQSYHALVSVSIPSDHCLLAQQPFYPYLSVPSQEYYPHQTMPIMPVVVQEFPPEVTHNAPSPAPVDMYIQQRQ